MTNEELVIKIKNGIDTADNMLALWEQMKKFITMIAKKYTDYAELEDLEQEGYLALYKAVDGYKMTEGVPFINYAAYWIHQGMKIYIKNYGSVVRIPVHEYETITDYKKTMSLFYKEHGRKPSRHETARQMGVSLEKVKRIEKSLLIRQTGSLDVPLSEDGEHTVSDTVPGNDNVEESVLNRIEHEELEAVLWGMVDALPEQQGKVLHQRYQEGKTLKATGESMGVTLERVRQIEQKAMRNMGCSRNIRLLRSFLPEAIESTAYRHNGVNEFNRTWTSSTELAALKWY